MLLRSQRPSEIPCLYFHGCCSVLVEWTRPNDRHRYRPFNVMGRPKDHDVERILSRSEVQKLEQEFWNLTMEGSEVNAYITRFTELAVLCPGMVAPEYKKIERYIWGLARQIRGMVITSQLTTFESVKNLAVRLTDKGVRQGIMVQEADPPQREGNKRKSQEISDNEEEGNDSGSEQYNGSDSGSDDYDESDLESEEYDEYVFQK